MKFENAVVYTPKEVNDILKEKLELHRQQKAKEDMKYDGGKPLAAIPFEDFNDAIKELIRVCTFGANKYARSSWKNVENAERRYKDAMARHFIDQFVEDKDEESGLYHKAHLAWNALAVLQLEIERKRNSASN